MKRIESMGAGFRSWRWTGWCLVFGLVGHLSAQQPLWQKMFTAGERHGFDLTRLQAEAQRAKASAKQTLDCDTVLYAQYLHAITHLYSNMLWEDDPELEGLACEWHGSPLFHMAATRAYWQSDYAAATQFYQGALREAEQEDKYQQLYALEGLAVSLVAQSKYSEAMTYFNRAYAMDSVHLEPSHLNNMSFAAYASGACEDAYHFAELSMERLEDLHIADANAFRLYRGAQNIALLNQLQAALSMNRPDLASQAFGGIQFSEAFEGRESAAVRLATLYCQSQNAVEQFAFVRSQLQDLLTLAADSDPLLDLGANARLFEAGSNATWRSIWPELLEVPVALRGGIEGHCEGVGEMHFQPASRPSSGPWPAVAWAGGGAALLAGWGLVQAWGRRRNLLDLESDSPNTWQAIVEQRVTSSVTAPRNERRQRERALRAFHLLLARRPANSLMHLPGWSDWTPVEQEVAVGLASGERTKAIAQRLGVDLAQVYAARKGLRQRLRIGEQESLEHWLRQKSR